MDQSSSFPQWGHTVLDAATPVHLSSPLLLQTRAVLLQPRPFCSCCHTLRLSEETRRKLGAQGSVEPRCVWGGGGTGNTKHSSLLVQERLCCGLCQGLAGAPVSMPSRPELSSCVTAGEHAGLGNPTLAAGAGAAPRPVALSSLRPCSQLWLVDSEAQGMQATSCWQPQLPHQQLGGKTAPASLAEQASKQQACMFHLGLGHTG